MKFEKKNIKWIVLGILLILFVEIIENVLNNDFLKYDMMIYNWISKTDTLNMIMKCITQIGSTIGMLILTIIFAFYIKPRKKAVLVPINLVIITVLNQTLKFIIQRPRPTDINMITEIGYSFPSGHTMTSVAFFGLLIYLLYKSKISQNKKILLSILLTFLVC